MSAPVLPLSPADRTRPPIDLLRGRALPRPWPAQSHRWRAARGTRRSRPQATPPSYNVRPCEIVQTVVRVEANRCAWWDCLRWWNSGAAADRYRC